MGKVTFFVLLRASKERTVRTQLKAFVHFRPTRPVSIPYRFQQRDLSQHVSVHLPDSYLKPRSDDTKFKSEVFAVRPI